MKVKLIAIAKNEGAYLAEWVHHHLYFGFSSVEIILNQCTDNSREIMEFLSKEDPRVSFWSGDPLKSWCDQNGTHIQREAYKAAFLRSSADQDYIMFLDLDEFWMPSDFKTSISDFLQSLPVADSVSFAWHTDLPEREPTFSLAVKGQMRLKKDRLVKSILSTRKTPKTIDIHNSVIVDGVYLLSDGHVFENKHADCNHYAVIPPFINDEPVVADGFYILYRIYRSEIEYLASLLRGNPDMDNPRVLKENRWGYILPNHGRFLVSEKLPGDRFEQYSNSLGGFLTRSTLSSLIDHARSLLLERCESVINHITSFSPDTFLKLIAGVSLTSMPQSYKSVGVRHCVDHVAIKNNLVEVLGWAFDESSGKSLRPKLRVNGSQTIVNVERPDVSKTHSIASQSTGFGISIGCESLELLSAVWLDFYLGDELVASKSIDLTDCRRDQ